MMAWQNSLFVGGCYMFGAVGNLCATRGRHPGWREHARRLTHLRNGDVR